MKETSLNDTSAHRPLAVTVFFYYSFYPEKGIFAMQPVVRGRGYALFSYPNMPLLQENTEKQQKN